MFWAALWAQMFLSLSAESLSAACQLYMLFQVNTKPKMTLLRIRLGRDETSGFAAVVVSDDAERSAASPGSDLIG